MIGSSFGILVTCAASSADGSVRIPWTSFVGASEICWTFGTSELGEDEMDARTSKSNEAALVFLESGTSFPMRGPKMPVGFENVGSLNSKVSSMNLVTSGFPKADVCHALTLSSVFIGVP